MARAEQENHLVLEPLGLSAGEERLYRLLLREPELSVSELARMIGVSGSRIRELATALEEKGLVGRTARKGGRWIVASAPDLALEGLFSRKREELEHARQLGKRLVEEMGSGAPRHLLDAITVVEAEGAYRQQCVQLHSTVREEMLMFDKPIYPVPRPKLNVQQLSRMAEGVTYRTIYEASTWSEPLLENAQRYVEAGEQARVVEELPVTMMVADRAVAILSLQSPQDAEVRGVAIVRSPGMVRALTQLFEATWTLALPFTVEENTAEDELSTTDRTILAMMVSGLKDEAIARQLEVDPSTVRRRIKAMLERLGARTRFQAGIKAAKTGWL